MTQNEFRNTLGKLGCLDTYLDIIEHLERHFSAEEMARLKKEPIFFYLGANERDQDRIWNAIECRLHKRSRTLPGNDFVGEFYEGRSETKLAAE